MRLGDRYHGRAIGFVEVLCCGWDPQMGCRRSVGYRTDAGYESYVCDAFATGSGERGSASAFVSQADSVRRTNHIIQHMADRPGGRSFGSASAYGTGVPPAFGRGLGPAAASRPGTLQHGSERSISGSSGESQQRTHRHGAGAPGGAWHQLTPVCADPGACRCPPSAESTPQNEAYVELTPEELLAWQARLESTRA